MKEIKEFTFSEINKSRTGVRLKNDVHLYTRLIKNNPEFFHLCISLSVDRSKDAFIKKNDSVNFTYAAGIVKLYKVRLGGRSLCAPNTSRRLVVTYRMPIEYIDCFKDKTAKLLNVSKNEIQFKLV